MSTFLWPVPMNLQSNWSFEITGQSTFHAVVDKVYDEMQNIHTPHIVPEAK